MYSMIAFSFDLHRVMRSGRVECDNNARDKMRKGYVEVGNDSCNSCLGMKHQMKYVDIQLRTGCSEVMSHSVVSQAATANLGKDHKLVHSGKIISVLPREQDLQNILQHARV